MDALQLYMCEAKALPLRGMSKVSRLRHEIESLRHELARDAQVMEFLSMRTKTPYVQFSMTKQFGRQASSDSHVPSTVPNSKEGAGSAPLTLHDKFLTYEGLVTASTTSPSDGVGAAAGAGATGGGAVSTFAAPTSEPTSLPPI